VSESIHSLVLRFDSADAVGAWTNSLTQAIYKTSAPLALTAVDDGGEPSGEEEEAEPVDVAMAKSLFFVGVLEELTISLNGRATIASHTSIDRLVDFHIFKQSARIVDWRSTRDGGSSFFALPPQQNFLEFYADPIGPQGWGYDLEAG
jgi:hypothetical protein